MTDQPLSEKIWFQDGLLDRNVIEAKDVKRAIQEFLKELKEEILNFVKEHLEDGQSKDYCFYALKGKFINENIDTLAKQNFGDKLLEAEK